MHLILQLAIHGSGNRRPSTGPLTQPLRHPHCPLSFCRLPLGVEVHAVYHSLPETHKGVGTQARRSRGGWGLHPPHFLLMYDIKIEAFDRNRKFISFFRVKVHSPLKSTSVSIILLKTCVSIILLRTCVSIILPDLATIIIE